MSNIPPPPPGYSLDRRSQSTAPDLGDDIVVRPLDGDTLALQSGRHLRLWGVDAPELRQQGWDQQGRPVPIGQQSLEALSKAINANMARLGQPIGMSYGRPVAPVTVGGNDLGLSMVGQGEAYAAPSYISGDPQRRYNYVQAERLARQNFLGLHKTFNQPPDQFRRNPSYQPSREDVAQFWDTPTPNAGLSKGDEQAYIALAHTGTAQQLIDFATAHGAKIDPDEARQFVANRNKGVGVLDKVYYRDAPKLLTDPGDGRTGSGARGLSNGVLFNQLEELGAGVDTLGLTRNRENIWNSNRRLADIFSNNLSQNEAITGFDQSAHPYAYGGGELAGSLVVPMARVRSAADLAKWGAAYGGLTGLGQPGSIPERLTSGVIGAGEGAATTILGTRALEAITPHISRMFGRKGEAVAGSAVGVAEGLSDDIPPPPDGFAVNGPDGRPARVPDRIDVGPSAPKPEAPREPIPTADPGRNDLGRERDWLDINGIPAPPKGFRVNIPGNDNQQIASTLEEVRLMSRRPMASEGEPTASVSQDLRRPDYLDMSGRPQRLTDSLNEQQMARVANDIQPRDVLPIPSNEMGSVEEAAARDAGRYVEAKPVDESTALGSRTVTSQNGRELPKRGPLDLVTWLRSQGGIRDQGGDLRAMGIDNAPRDMDFARGEQRFGKLVSDQGMSLDDAAMKAWEAGYLPGNERPDINTLLDAIDRTHSGAERYFHPDDLPEVEQFHGMRQDRQALEAQLADGPVHVDRSVPAGPDQPFAPPEAHEDWPAGGPDFAGNIRLEKLNTPQDISRALSTVGKRVGFDASTRGRVTQVETERLASELNMTPEQLISRRKGQAFNAEEALAARQLLAKSGNELVNLARKVQRLENPGDDVLAYFNQALRRHAAIQEQVSGMTAEAGRTLQQFRMLADSRNVPGEVLARLVDGNGGRQRLQDAADTILETVESEPGKFNPLIEKLAKSRWIDKAIELRYNMLLSGPQTHAANIISNTLTALGQFPEHAVAAGLGLARRGVVGSEAAADRVYASELGSRAFGLLAGTKEGIGQFLRTLLTGQTSDLVTKVEAQVQEAIPGKLGKVARAPSRALSAEDELFKAMARKMELYGLADRTASAEGLSGKAKADRVADLIANPPDDMLAKTFDYARYITFQSPLTGIPQGVSALTNRYPVLKYFIPFVRTPTNLFKYAAERSPAAPLLRNWRADVAAGGARRDLALSKAMVGTGVAAWMADLARQGIITGSPPDDANKERALRADGWQPNSVRIGDRYVSYNRLDPFAMTIGTAADLATKQDGMTARQLDDSSGLLVASLIHSMGDRTWLSGMSDLFSMLSDPQRNLGGYTRNQAASLVVPAGVAQIARDVDPTRRATHTVGEEIQSRIPFASRSLLPQRNIWGQPIVTDRLGPEFVSPITQTERRNDPVNAEMLRLGATATNFPKQHTVDGKRVDYSPEEYDQLSAKAGKLSHDAIAGLIGSPGWKALAADTQRKAIQNAIRDSRADARGTALAPGSLAKMVGATMPRPPAGFTAQGGSQAVPPPPAGYSVDGEAGGRNVYADLLRVIPGLSADNLTSGFRTPEYQADMKRRGYHPANNSGHLDGSSFDITVPRGRSMNWLISQVKAYDPKARLLPEGDHLHATFPGYFGAPALGGARGAGLKNPLAGMPPPPRGFTIDAR